MREESVRRENQCRWRLGESLRLQGDDDGAVEVEGEKQIENFKIVMHGDGKLQ